MGETTGAIIVQTLIVLMEICVAVIMVRYLLWPLFKKQPIAMGIAFAVCVIAFAVMFMLDL